MCVTKIYSTYINLLVSLIDGFVTLRYYPKVFYTMTLILIVFVFEKKKIWHHLGSVSVLFSVYCSIASININFLKVVVDLRETISRCRLSTPISFSLPFPPVYFVIFTHVWQSQLLRMGSQWQEPQVEWCRNSEFLLFSHNYVIIMLRKNTC